MPKLLPCKQTMNKYLSLLSFFVLWAENLVSGKRGVSTKVVNFRKVTLF